MRIPARPKEVIEGGIEGRLSGCFFEGIRRVSETRVDSAPAQPTAKLRCYFVGKHIRFSTKHPPKILSPSHHNFTAPPRMPTPDRIPTERHHPLLLAHITLETALLPVRPACFSCAELATEEMYIDHGMLSSAFVIGRSLSDTSEKLSASMRHQ